MATTLSSLNFYNKKWKMEENLNQYTRNIQENKKYITLTHHNKSTKKIAKIKKLKYNISYTTNSTLQKDVTNETTHNNKQEKYTSIGVYKVKYNGCLKFYIGQTSRSFKTQYTEHIKSTHTTSNKIKLGRTFISLITPTPTLKEI